MSTRIAGFHILRRAGYDETLITEVARTMEYHQAYSLYRSDIEMTESVDVLTLV